jgi:methanogenic corrinoid protein MtbC1
MRRKGYEVIYLGSSIKEDDIDVVISTVKPRFLFMSCTMDSNLSQTLNLTKSLERNFSNLVVGLGGFAIDSLSSEIKEKYQQNIIGSSMIEWDKWVEEKTYTN